MNKILLLVITLMPFGLFAQIPVFQQISDEPESNIEQKTQQGFSRTPTDTLMLHQFKAIPGTPSALGYGYSNGNGYFFGTNYLDLDQNASTPYEPGTQAIAQGYKIDTTAEIQIEAVLMRIGYKSKTSPTGTFLPVNLHLMDATSNYSVNTGTGTVSYTIKCPGTSIGSATIPWDSIKASSNSNVYTIARIYPPATVNRHFMTVIDLMDFYTNGDKIAFVASPNGGASQIYGKEYTLWLYPNPFMWVQVTHIYSAVDRCIALFPVIDDGTSGITQTSLLQGIKLSQNYPNPASGMTTIGFEISNPCDVVLQLIENSGKLILTEERLNTQAGKHYWQIDTHQLASGIYYYTLTAGDNHLGRKLIVE